MKKNIKGSIQDTMIYVIFFFLLAFALGGVLFMDVLTSGNELIGDFRNGFISYIPIELRFGFYVITLGMFAAIGKNLIR